MEGGRKEERGRKRGGKRGINAGKGEKRRGVGEVGGREKEE